MKVYSKTGDNGMTSLAGGKRVRKDDTRVEALGTIDELQSYVGVLASVTDGLQLEDIQRVLFRIGEYLACEEAKDAGVADEMITLLEHRIDRLSGELPPLHSFVIPGGAMAASICHVCRTVCRRAERRMIALRHSAEAEKDANIFIYINRLSAYFFLLARKLNKDTGFVEVTL